jgi:hypothetical protein
MSPLIQIQNRSFFSCYLLPASDNPNEIVCPCASEHLPCCKNCTDGFAVPFQIKQLIECKLKGDKQKSTTTDSSNVEAATTEEGHDENLKLTTAVIHDNKETAKYQMTEVDNKHCRKIKGESVLTTTVTQPLTAVNT